MAAHNWRALRTRFMGHGVAEAMDISSMHIVLDEIESLGLEAAVSGAKTEQEARAKVNSYHDKLYKPDVTLARVNGEEVPLGPPPGWDDDEVEASFDAFLTQGAR